MARAVRFAGGWLFDQVMAGWEATVLCSRQTDARPLRILGAHAVDLESALTAAVRGPGPQAIAADAALVESDHRVRRMVLAAVEQGAADVRLWGDRWPANLDGEAGPVQHHLSVAARAFKAQALAAAATADVEPGCVTEVFRRSRLGAPWGPADLMPTA
jgi:hypothetical protein